MANCYTEQIMKVPKRPILWSVVTLLIVAIFWSFLGKSEVAVTTTTVTRGEVSESISVSGSLEADQLAALGFPQPARLSALFIKEGAVVFAGDLLATVGSGATAADREQAIAQLREAEANREILLNGLTLEDRAVSSSTVAQAKTAYENTIISEEEKVSVAKATLYSTDLAARAIDAEEDSPAPTVSGSYQCENQGEYTVEVYRSSTNSGYSIRYSGLEEGVAPVSVDQPVALGDCGLSLQFTDEAFYGNSIWIIEIPNKHSVSYVSRLRNYELTQKQASANIDAARYVYELAEKSFIQQIAAPRIEDLIVANARVAGAQANIRRADALLADNAIYAPFDGVIAKIYTNIGETTAGPVLDMVASQSFSLVARVPEIDIAKLEVNQYVEAIFDAASDSRLSGVLSFISPIATVIDGVSYFETTITFNESPPWFRDGLNADIDIFLTTKNDTLRIPNRYIIETEAGHAVRVLRNKDIATTSIQVTLTGTNGYSAITGLTDGDVIVAP